MACAKYLLNIILVFSLIIYGLVAYNRVEAGVVKAIHQPTKVIKNPTVDEKMFIVAVSNGDLQTAKEMLANGVDVNARYPGFGVLLDTPLGVAIEKKDRAMQQLLLENHADVSGYTEARLFNKVEHYSYFVCAAQAYDYDLMEFLLGWGANVNDVSYETGDFSDRKNALIGAIRAQSLPRSKSEAQTLAHLEKMFDFLLSKGIDPNFVSNSRSALMEVVDMPHDDFCMRYVTPRTRRILYKKLLDAGADPNFKDNNGKTVLDYVLEERTHVADVEAAKLIQSYMN